jgi:hypothetical protein
MADLRAILQPLSRFIEGTQTILGQQPAITLALDQAGAFDSAENAVGQKGAAGTLHQGFQDCDAFRRQRSRVNQVAFLSRIRS